MIDFEKLHKTLNLAPGDKVTVEINGMTAELTAETVKVSGKTSKAHALQMALTASAITKEIRRQLVEPHPDLEALKQNAGDLIDAGEYLKKWADQ